MNTSLSQGSSWWGQEILPNRQLCDSPTPSKSKTQSLQRNGWILCPSNNLPYVSCPLTRLLVDLSGFLFEDIVPGGSLECRFGWMMSPWCRLVFWPNLTLWPRRMVVLLARTAFSPRAPFRTAPVWESAVDTYNLLLFLSFQISGFFISPLVSISPWTPLTRIFSIFIRSNSFTLMGKIRSFMSSGGAL